MAALKAKPKFVLYQALYNLNAAFESLAAEIERLTETKTIRPATLKLYRATSEELRSAINHRVTGVLLMVEERDWHHFGHARIRQEKRVKVTK